MKPSQEELLREARNNLRVGLLTGLLGGVLLGLLFATATFALNPELLDSVKDVLVLSLGLQAVYAVFCLALGLLGALGKTILFAFTGRSLSDTKTAAFVTGTVFFLITMTYGYLWCRWHRIGGLVPEHRPTMAELPVLLVVAAVAVLLARLLTYAFYLLIVHFKKPDRRQPGDMRKAFFVLLYMVGAFVIFLVVLQLTRPGENHFAGLSREDVVAVDHPVVLLGIDGLDRSDVERMLGAGRLSSFARGAKAAVTVGGQPIPPVAWTLVATGRTLEAHGIVDYQAQLVRGLSRPFTVSPNQVGLFQLFQDVLPFFRLTRPVPMRSYMRGSKGLWNIASDAGLESAVVNWWVSYPAEKVQGRMVSNQTFLRLVLEGKAGRESGHNSRPDDPDVGGSSVGAGSGSGMRSGSGSDGTKITDPSARSEDPHGPLRLEGQGETFPSSLLQELAPLADAAPDDSLRDRYAPVPPAPVSQAFAELSIPAEVVESDLFYARTTSYLLETGHPRLCMVYLPGPDVLRRLIDREITDPASRTEAWNRAFEAYWSALEPALDHLLADVHAMSARCILLTTPGQQLSPPDDPPEGYLGVTGPDVAPGALPDPFSLTDLAPTLLWLLGLPASTEMPGRTHVEILDPAGQNVLGEPRAIASYGRLEADVEDPGSQELDAPMLELLRSLGYIDR